jgi:hypothetical protein
MTSIGRDDLINSHFSNDVRICERHFTQDMFADKRLKRDSVPSSDQSLTLNINSSSSSSKKNTG